uniref:Uncharacterized protein n=1 Tax=Meloidogyne javanica TaxID=6303 RepID=A0A915LLX9_MELJA
MFKIFWIAVLDFGDRITMQPLLLNRLFSAEIDKYYETHPEKYEGEKKAAKELHKAMEEAGPSTLTLPTKVMAPDVDQTIIFVGTIMKAIDTITEANSDPILLLMEAKAILHQILTNLNIVSKHCNAMVKRTGSPTSSRTMNALFAPEDAFDYYGAEQIEIVEETDEVAHETKKKFDEKMKSLSKYTDAWNGAVDLIKGVEHVEQFKRRLDEMNMDNLKFVIKNVLEKPKMKKKKNLN